MALRHARLALLADEHLVSGTAVLPTQSPAHCVQVLQSHIQSVIDMKLGVTVHTSHSIESDPPDGAFTISLRHYLVLHPLSPAARSRQHSTSPVIDYVRRKLDSTNAVYIWT